MAEEEEEEAEEEKEEEEEEEPPPSTMSSTWEVVAGHAEVAYIWANMIWANMPNMPIFGRIWFN